MINVFKKNIQIHKKTTIVVLFLLIIGFFAYQISQVQAVNTSATPPVSLCSITRDLYEGIIGSDVKELQQYLNNNGFSLAQTGVGSKGRETNYFGSLTKQALVNFQIKNKLNNTGIFDLATRNFLDCGNGAGETETGETETNTPSVSLSPLCSITRDLYEGIIGSDVKELQKYLNNNGFSLAQTGVGSKGRETNIFDLSNL